MQTLSYLCNLRKATLLLGIGCLIALNSLAQQAGELDLNFNPNEKGRIQGRGFSLNSMPESQVRSIVGLANGKFLVGGRFDSYNGEAITGHIARLNPDGTLDPTFKTSTLPIIGVNKILVQADGKILLNGILSGFNSGVILRLNADGSVDNTFQSGNGTNGLIFDLQIQKDGKIIAAGNFNTYNGQNVPGFIRLNADGSVDTTFDVLGLRIDINEIIFVARIQADGKILIGGGFENFNNTGANFLIRLNPDGSPDTTFNKNLGDSFNEAVGALSIQENGKILVGGLFTSFDGNIVSGLTRLEADGRLDTAFNTNILGLGFDILDSTPIIALEPDGQIIVAGSLFPANGGGGIFGVIRLNAQGTLDTSFNEVREGTILAILILPNGKIILGGSFQDINEIQKGSIARLNSNGSLDLSFDPIVAFDRLGPRGILTLENNQILVLGGFSVYNNERVRGIARINADGSLDKSFDPEVGSNDFLSTLLSQPDGKIIVAGGFENADGSRQDNVARLNPNGSVDTSFDPGIGFDNDVNTLSLLPNGQILVGGSFSTFRGESRNKITLLNADGTLASSFDPGMGFDRNVTSSLVLPNGQFLVGGDFNTYNGQNVSELVVLNADGSLDSSFNPNLSGFDDPIKIIPQGNGKFLVLFAWKINNELPILRLNSDLSIDNTFIGTSIPTDFRFNLRMAVQENRKIILGGFNLIPGNSDGSQLIRLNANGSLDNTFLANTNINSINIFGGINFAIQPNGGIIVSGDFLSYNGVARHGFVRLFGDAPPSKQQEVTEFVLVNPVTNQEVGTLSNNQSINLDDYEQQQGTKQFNIVAKTSPSSVGSVVFSLTGSINENRTENAAPYALFGDSNGNFRGKTLQLGSYNLKATPFSRSQRRGDEGQELSIQFQVVETPDTSSNLVTLTTSAGNGGTVSPNGSNQFNENTQVSVTATPNNGFQFKNFTFGNGNVASTSNPYTFTINANVTLVANFEAIQNNAQAVTSFTLVNANTGQPINGFDPIPNNAQIDINNIPNVPLNIQANTTPNNVGSVGFALRGAQNSDERENLAPYLLFDSGSSLNIVQDQNYTLTATPFSQRGLKGNAGTPLTINFSFVDGTPPPANGNAVTSFSLINANTGQVINGFETIPNNAQIDVGQIGTNLVNVQANTTPALVGSVGFEISGDRTSSERENVEPYWLFDRRNELNVNAGESFTVKATPFSEKGLKGNAGTPLTINFAFVNGFSVNVFPNPSTSSVTFSSESEAEQVALEIYCPQRGLVYKESFPGNLEHQVDMKALGSGIYVCKMIDNTGTKVEKTLVVE